VALARRYSDPGWGLYARILDDGRYDCVHEHLNVGPLFARLRAEITLGTYLLAKAMGKSSSIAAALKMGC
jgi:hypothetical protein